MLWESPPYYWEGGSRIGVLGSPHVPDSCPAFPDFRHSALTSSQAQPSPGRLRETPARTKRRAPPAPFKQVPQLQGQLLPSLTKGRWSFSPLWTGGSRDFQREGTEGQAHSTGLRHRKVCVHKVSFRWQGQKPKSKQVKPELEGPGVDFRHSWIQENIRCSLVLSWKLPCWAGRVPGPQRPRSPAGRGGLFLQRGVSLPRICSCSRPVSQSFPCVWGPGFLLAQRPGAE